MRGQLWKENAKDVMVATLGVFLACAGSITLGLGVNAPIGNPCLEIAGGGIALLTGLNLIFNARHD